MTVVAQGKIAPAGGGVPLTLQVESLAGAASYTTSGDAYTITGFHNVKAVLAASMDTGYVPVIKSFTAGTVTIAVYQQYAPAGGGGANVPLVEVTAATDISAATLILTVIGD